MDILNNFAIKKDELLSFSCWNDQGASFQLIVGSQTIQILSSMEINIFLISLKLRIEILRREGFLIEININDIIYKANHENIVQFCKHLNSRITYLGIQDNYQILKQIGRGGQSEGVYEVQRIDSQEIKAMKQYDKSKQSIEKIHKEIKITQKFQSKNVIKINEIYESECSVFIIFEKLQLFDPKDYNQQQKIQFIFDLLNIIQVMHSLGYMHRDIKLSNIMINSLNEIKLIDFGLATKCKKQHKQCGTPGHMAPEIFFSMKYNEQCDIYSLGVLIYEMLSQKQLFLGMNKKDIKNKNQLGIFDHQKFSLLQWDLQQLLKEMLQKDPNLRISAKKALLSSLFAKELSKGCLTNETQMHHNGQKII